MTTTRKKQLLLSTVLILNIGLPFNGFSMGDDDDGVPSSPSANSSEGSVDDKEFLGNFSSLSLSESSSSSSSAQPSKFENDDSIKSSTPSYKSRLFLGEGDFSYTLSLLKKHQEKHPELSKNITTTEKNDENTLREIYADSFDNIKRELQKDFPNVKIEFGVDATNIHERYKGQHFKRIHFNMPNDALTFKGQTLPKIIKDFFASAAQIQKKGDRIHMALPYNKKDPFREHTALGNNYRIHEASSENGYILVHKRKFKEDENLRYPGYRHRVTDSGDKSAGETTQFCREYIFEYSGASKEDILDTYDSKKTPPRLKSVKSSYLHYGGDSSLETIYALPLLKTDSDSSDYEEINSIDKEKRSRLNLHDLESHLYSTQKKLNDSISEKETFGPGYWYQDQDINNLLEQYLPEANYYRAPASVTVFENPELLEASITNALTQANDGLTVAMPIHLHGNHWCSLVIKMRDDANGKKFIAVFNNPTGEAVEGEPNVTNFIMHLQESSKALGAIEPTIIDLRYRQQTNDDDCGPFVVDNLVKLSRLGGLENLEAAGAILNIANLSHRDATGIREVHRIVLGHVIK